MCLLEPRERTPEQYTQGRPKYVESQYMEASPAEKKRAVGFSMHVLRLLVSYIKQ